MRKAFGYLRVSGRGQVEGDGFPRQLAAIRVYARVHRIRIIRVFREEGVSGAKDLQNRPALAEMLESLHADGVKLILIEKLDRLARDLMVQETIIGDLQRHGFELISVAEPDLLEDDPSRKAFRQMMGVFSEYEKSTIVLKLRGARNRVRARTGRCEGRKPYGFYPGEQKVIGRMKELRAKGLSYDRVAATLNSEGLHPRRHGTRWFGSGVNRILSAHGITKRP